MKVLDVYDTMMEEIQSIYRSRLQLQILLSLVEGNKTLADLREITGSTSQAIIPKIRILEASRYIGAVDYEYYLTPSGRIIATKIQDYVMATAVIHRNRDFFADHYLQGIPPHLLMSIGDLYDSAIISDTNVDIFNVFFNFVKMVNEGNRICILSPIGSPAHTDAIAKRVAEGIPVELVIGKDLAQHFYDPPYFEMVKKLTDRWKGFVIYVVDAPIRIGLTVTDSCLSLGLYKTDGITYDTTTDLFSKDPVAVAWAQRLFDYYKNQAKPLRF